MSQLPLLLYFNSYSLTLPIAYFQTNTTSLLIFSTIPTSNM